jgi:hypothetical protein
MKTKGPKQDSQKIKNSMHIFFFFHSVYKKEKIEDTKGLIRSCKTKDILYNDLNFLFDFCTKKGAFDSHPQVTKFTSCLSMVGGSLWVFRLLPPLKLVAMIINSKNVILRVSDFLPFFVCVNINIIVADKFIN